MSAFTPASEVLLRHSDDFESARVLFAGDLQDDLPARLDTAASRAHTQQFHHWQVLSRQMAENARFSLGRGSQRCCRLRYADLLLAKNKPEAQFQLMNLLSCCRSVLIFSWLAKTAAACAAPSRCWRNMRR